MTCYVFIMITRSAKRTVRNRQSQWGRSNFAHPPVQTPWTKYEYRFKYTTTSE